jgi:hypothetical protein
MKQWTKAEAQWAKIRINVEYKMGKLPIKTKDLILRPSRMGEKDLETLIKIFETYGKSR